MYKVRSIRALIPTLSVLLFSSNVVGNNACASFRDDTYSLKRVYKVGETDQYKSTFTIEGGLNIEINLVSTDTTKELKDDGRVTIDTKLDSGGVNFNGTPQEIPGGAVGQTTTSRYDKSGKEIKTADGGNKDIAKLLGLSRFVYMPEKPVKVGEEVKIDVSNGEGNDKTVVKGTLKVVGVVKAGTETPLDSIKLNVVTDSVISGTKGEMKPHLEGVMFIEIGTGKVVAFNGKVSGVNAGQLGNTTIGFKSMWQKIEVKK